MTITFGIWVTFGVIFSSVSAQTRYDSKYVAQELYNEKEQPHYPPQIRYYKPTAQPYKESYQGDEPRYYQIIEPEYRQLQSKNYDKAPRYDSTQLRQEDRPYNQHSISSYGEPVDFQYKQNDNSPYQQPDDSYYHQPAGSTYVQTQPQYYVKDDQYPENGRYEKPRESGYHEPVSSNYDTSSVSGSHKAQPHNYEEPKVSEYQQHDDLQYSQPEGHKHNQYASEQAPDTVAKKRDPKLPLYFTMYEKRIVQDPMDKYGKGPWRYLTYGHGITYGSKEPGKVFEKGYGYIRALGRDHCKLPEHLCPPRDEKPFDYEGRKEPYFGYRPH